MKRASETYGIPPSTQQTCNASSRRKREKRTEKIFEEIIIKTCLTVEKYYL